MTWRHEEGDDESGAAASRIAAAIGRLRDRGESVEPLVCQVKSGLPCSTFWGRAWCENLEAYSDFADRMPRGRTDLRAGRVLGLEVMPGEAFAHVMGSDLHEVSIRVELLDEDHWRAFCASVGGQVGNLVDLLGGRIGEGALAAITAPGTGLFPEPGGILFDCSCPDFADMCRHVAAVLYGVGVKFDEQPELFFTLRGVDSEELLASASSGAGMLVDEAADVDASGAGLTPESLAELFGIELADPEAAFGAADAC